MDWETLVKLHTRISLASVSRETEIPESTIRDWRDQQDAIFAFEGDQRRKTLGGQGGKELVPFAHELVIL